MQVHVETMWGMVFSGSLPYFLSQGLSLSLELIDLSGLDGKEAAEIRLSLPTQSRGSHTAASAHDFYRCAEDQNT